MEKQEEKRRKYSKFKRDQDFLFYEKLGNCLRRTKEPDFQFGRWRTFWVQGYEPGNKIRTSKVTCSLILHWFMSSTVVDFLCLSVVEFRCVNCWRVSYRLVSLNFVTLTVAKFRIVKSRVLLHAVSWIAFGNFKRKPVYSSLNLRSMLHWPKIPFAIINLFS